MLHESIYLFIFEKLGFVLVDNRLESQGVLIITARLSL